jgi:hypothetical protein
MEKNSFFRRCRIFRKVTVIILDVCLSILVLSFTGCRKNNYLSIYKGRPFSDSIFSNPPQVIPGKIQCEYYDFGGEGIAYHDNDSVNSGSGALNPLNGTYLNAFRMQESVDISYTKSGGVDDNPYNYTSPEMDQLYVGWTAPGEWMNYTLEVRTKGTYAIGLMYTAHSDGAISLTIDDRPVTDSIAIPSTYSNSDTVAWRQWHHWRLIENLSEIALPQGKHILTLHTVENGNMNYDFLEFTLKK